jgi:hypothetical protein
MSVRKRIGIGKGNENKKVKSLDSGFLARIAAAKEKLADIQREKTAPFKDGEVRNLRLLEEQINPTIAGVFQEFLALIAPDGYEVSDSEKGWFVLEKEEPEPAPVTHVRLSARKSLCESRYIDRKLKGKVFAESNDDVTCPDCRSLLDEKKAKGASNPTAGESMEQPALGECDFCCDGTPATEVLINTPVCARCAAEWREKGRKYLRRQMSVKNCYGELSSWKRLRDDRNVIFEGVDGTVYVANKLDYLEWLRRRFLGNPRFNQTTVAEYIAEVEAKISKANARPAPQPGGGLSAQAKASRRRSRTEEQEASKDEGAIAPEDGQESE